jgi:hypothetical protein
VNSSEPRIELSLSGIALLRVVRIDRRWLSRPLVVIEWEPGKQLALHAGDTVTVSWSGNGPVTGEREVYLRGGTE